jgi:tyrosyl-tRNA synthetase
MTVTDSRLHDLLTRGVEEVIVKDDLETKLKAGKKLRVKLGIDPTSPNIHLGRSIPLLKLRDFQELGHQVVFIVGDFTGVIGDTSDKDSERPMLTRETIETNMRHYTEQAGKIIDLDKAEIHYNSTWLEKLSFREIGEQADCFSVAEFIARDNIRRRLDAGTRVSLREMLYPLMQGYDSVAIRSDVELGGTDQRFNLLAGRALQERSGQAPQNIIMGPLIEGLDGRKMSSSWGNTINLTAEASDMYGKVMALRDDLVIKYFTLVTRVPLTDVKEYESALRGGANPRDIKMKLAFELVKMYHSSKAAVAAEEAFVKTFSKKEIPTDLPELKPSAYDIVTILIEAGFVKSKTEARQVIAQGGVKVGEEKISAIEAVIKPGSVVQKGSRYFVQIL